MKDFLFAPQQARTPVRVLSGGERARLLLAKALAQSSNLLVLDEPTNDLDLETLDLLEEMVDEYPGTVIMVSHDRDFLDRVATSILMADGDGRFVEYAGGYSDMIAQRGSGVQARPPSREKQAKATVPKERRSNDPAKRAMNFSDKHELRTLPHKLTELDRQIFELQTQLADPTLFSRDPKKFAGLSQSLAEAQHEHAASEERWLQLEMLREDLERE
jgi:ATP-binding cassette subfamily F protein uup